MRVVIQRVKSSSVTVNEEIIGKIGRGLNLLVGISPHDTDTEIEWIARKCLDLRIFPGDSDSSKWEKSVTDIQGELLVVSQFTLYGDCHNFYLSSLKPLHTKNFGFYVFPLLMG
ncbi:MAG: D-aminoacyl-tRNA deacylase [Xenococcaceae cyanobacterium MO_207.B15]|nr:D-aminoacyl-tRNA deacylase [Xenococcaceae cyanobacterium MO_207.B15]